MRISDWSSDVCSSDLVPRRISRCCPVSARTPRDRSQPSFERSPTFVSRRVRKAARCCRPAEEYQRTQPFNGNDYNLFRITMVGAAAGRLSRSQPERSEEHTSELQSLMRISYAVFCLKKKKKKK